MLYLRRLTRDASPKAISGERDISGFDRPFTPIPRSSAHFSTYVRSALHGVLPPLQPAQDSFTRLRVCGTRLGTPVSTRFRSGSLPSLTSPRASNSLAHSTKARRHTAWVLRRLAGARFQVLFHSLPGCFSPFPHGTGALSVTWEYSGLRVVPPGSDRVSRAWSYSGDRPGSIPGCAYGAPNPVPPAFPCRSAPLDGCRRGRQPPDGRLQPRGRQRLAPARSTVWPRSPFARRYSGNLDVDFFSSGYLDVSVPLVVPLPAMCSPGGCQDSPGGFAHSETRGSKGVCP